MSRVFDVTSPQPRREGLAAATAAVRAGGLVVLPTDTVYGLGCDAFDRSAVARLLAAKGRGRQMPPPVLVGHVGALDGLATDVPAYARELVAEFWPGALTLVLTAQPSLSWDLGDTRGTVALRMPACDVALDLLMEIGPMAVSSANVTGSPAAQSVTEAAVMLGPQVAVYLDNGPAPVPVASTILDCTGPTPVILRAGALSDGPLREPRWAHLWPGEAAAEPTP